VGLVRRAFGTHAGRVHLARLRLRDFRNYARLDAGFVPGFHVLLGQNAQGKTNVLEAIYLLSTLRSFRGVGGAQMIRHGAKGYFAGATVVGAGESEIKAYWAVKERKLSVDGRPVRKLTEYLGILRSVVFCTEDLQLVKGAARGRRRFLDLLLAQTEPGYLALLLRYTKALRSRNALLKQPVPDDALLQSFTVEMVDLGNRLVEARTALLPRIAPVIGQAYAQVSRGRDEFEITYQPAVRGDFAVELAKSRARERVMRTTLVGPHRDELVLRLNGQLAAAYASEGQKRTIAIALKMAQAEHLGAVHGVMPVLLIDDVMGELDAARRAGLIPLLQRAHRTGGQVFMTCTEENWPSELGETLHRWKVDQGVLTPA
jgi:DNA replication and repair protein RecF